MFGIDVDQVIQELRSSVKVLHDLLQECKEVNKNLKELICINKKLLAKHEDVKHSTDNKFDLDNNILLNTKDKKKK